MPGSRRALLVGLLLFATAPLAGCFGAEAIPDERTVSASGGKISPGWAYDGQGVAVASATLSGTINNPDNAGSFEVSFDHAGSKWAVVFDEFAGAKDFMDGGVAFDLVEHGDSGVADASIPKILATIAAWGTASVTRDGVPVTSFSGPDARWSAHLMVSDTTVRGADGRILKADGATAYDPSAPGDATRTEGDAQAFLKLVHPDGETAKREPTLATQAFEFSGPESSGTMPVEIAAGARSVVINATATASAAPIGVGQVTVRVLDSAGTELDARSSNVVPNQPVAFTFEFAPDQLALAPLQVEVKGQGAFKVDVDATVAYDDHPLLVLTWDEVTLE